MFKLDKIRIKVTSNSFSKNPLLKKELLSSFPNSFFNPSIKPSGIINLVEFLKDADGVILGLEQLNYTNLKHLKKLKVISKFGVGIDNIDIDAATKLGITVKWTSGINKRSASEQALCFMIGLSRNLFFSSFNLNKGHWIKDGGRLLSEKCVGIIGCGHIGTDLIKLLTPFNCKILICDLIDKSPLVKKYAISQVSLENLIMESDIISLHVPLTELTKNMVNNSFLEKMKPSAYLINNSRGLVVNQEDLKNSLKNNIISGAAIDVFENEPPDDLELLSLPNLIVTPHIGGNASEAVIAMGRSAIKNLKEFFTNE